MPPRAVLFDFDGVLADTENIHVAAWQRTFEVMGWVVPDEECRAAAELDDQAFLAGAFQRRGVTDGDIPGWVARKQELAVAMFRDSPRLYPGVASLIHRLRPLVQLAVVTTTWRANVEAVLVASGLRDAFALIVAKEDVAARKPDPEPYQLAVDRLGLLGDDAVALEDSPTGLASARGAGVLAVAVGHRRPERGWAGNAPFLPGLTDAAAVLSVLGLRE